MSGERPTSGILMSAVPIALAILVFGASFGVLATAARLPAWAVVMMSLLVFAGSAQFAAIGVIAAGGGVPAAIFAGSLLNLRFVATGIAVASVLRGPRWLRALRAQLVIDESYALGTAAGEPGRPDRRTLLLSGALFYGAWTLGTISGVALGPALGDPNRLGLDAAFPAGFVALLWPMLSARNGVRCALAGGAIALVLAPFTPAGIPLAGAAAMGLWLSRSR